MPYFQSAHASGDVSTLLQRCLQQLGEMPPTATLGFIYATVQTVESLPAIMDELKGHSPGVHWLGCVGEGICAGGHEYYDEPALSLLLTDIPHHEYCLLSSGEELFTELPHKVVSWCEQHQECYGLLHAVPTYMATSTYAKQISRAAPGATLNGGLSSGAGAYRHIDNAPNPHGISGVLFDQSQNIISAHTQGCTPISGNLQIDEAHQNMVQQLEGRPALEVLKEAVGEVLWRDKQRLGNYIFIGLPDECGNDDYLVRNLMGLDLEGGAIAVGDLVEHHSQLRICRRDGNAARDDMVAMLQRLKQQLGGRSIRGGIYVSCVGRGRRQFGEDSDELKLIAEQLGEFPLAGFFANGEFYRGRLYSYTGVLTLFV